MAAVAPLLKTRALSKHFDGVNAVENVDFSLSEGEIRAVIGPNGAGKTTLVSHPHETLDPGAKGHRLYVPDYQHI